jgi:hypothetical protein
LFYNFLLIVLNKFINLILAIIMFYSAVYATVLTAFWAVQNRTLPLRGILYAFVLVGALAALVLLLLPDKNSIAVVQVVQASGLLAAYQAALFFAFSEGPQYVQAVVNLNIVVIIIIDAVRTEVIPSPVVVAASVMQVAGAFLVQTHT